MKKMLLSIGTVAAVATPVATVVACGQAKPAAIQVPGAETGTTPGTTSGTNPGATPGNANVKTPVWTGLKINDDGKVLSIDKNVTWTVEGDTSHVQGATQKVDIYHTSLFDYVIATDLLFDGVKYNQAIVEKLAHLFETNTSIGVEHYSDNYTSNFSKNANAKYRKNFPIQFLKGTGSASWGGLYEVSMIDATQNPVETHIDKDGKPSTDKNDRLKTINEIGEGSFISQAELMMHEYGHHIITFGSYLTIPQADKVKLRAKNPGVYWPMYENLLLDFQKDPILKRYTKYFPPYNGKGELSGDAIRTTKDWKSPWGDVPIGAQAWDPKEYGYVFSPGEILTRVMSEMEGTIDPSHFSGNGWSGLMDMADANAMSMAFDGHHPLESKESIQHFNDFFKKDIFGLGASGKGGVPLTGQDANSLIEDGAGMILTDPDAIPKGEVTYNINISNPANAGWAIGQYKQDGANGPVTATNKNGKGIFTAEESDALDDFFQWSSGAISKTITFKLGPNSFDKYPVRYKLNTAIENGKYTTEITNGNYFVFNRTVTPKDKVLNSALTKYKDVLASYSYIKSSYKLYK